MILVHGGRPPAAARTPAELLDALLFLSRSLRRSHPSGMLSAALELLLSAVGCEQGAAYVVHDDDLWLAAHRGLPEALRPWLERLPLKGEPPFWLLVQQAVESRTLLVAKKMLVAGEAPVDLHELRAAGWDEIVACPISNGREVLGAIVIGGTSPDFSGTPVRALLEIACQVIAPQLAYLHAATSSGSPESYAARRVRERALSLVTHASALEGPLDEIERNLDQQDVVARELRMSSMWAYADELTAATEVARHALARARAGNRRLLAAAELGVHEVATAAHAVGQHVDARVPPLVATGVSSSRRPRPETTAFPVARGSSVPPIESTRPSAHRAGVGSSRPSAEGTTAECGLQTSVLIVDDDAAIREVVSEILLGEGYLVDTAADGNEALECIRRHGPPGLVLLDLVMPGMDGWHFLAEVKDDAVLADIPVVVMSAVASSFEGPAVEVMSKPVDYGRLLAAVGHWAKTPGLGAPALAGVDRASRMTPLP